MDYRSTDLSTDTLQAIYSDFYKDLYGCRPTPISSREELLYGLELLQADFHAMLSTDVGREELANNGWYFEREEVQ
jgi:hypothetical protein